MKKTKRALSVNNLLSMKFKMLEFDGAFLKSFGKPEANGVWIVWAHSGNGKTGFAVQLLKYLTKFGRGAYDTLEEGARSSFQRVAIRENLKAVEKKLIILNREPIEELKVRLRKPKSPDFIIIDSFQYTGLTKKGYKQLKEEFPKKLFIFISHAEGKHPEGRTAKFIRYDADVKIRVEGYKAMVVSRFGGGEPFTIWDEGAAEYWAEIE